MKAEQALIHEMFEAIWVVETLPENAGELCRHVAMSEVAIASMKLWAWERRYGVDFRLN